MNILIIIVVCIDTHSLIIRYLPDWNSTHAFKWHTVLILTEIKVCTTLTRRILSLLAYEERQKHTAVRDLH